jgi:SPP1 gp7 family putative phage head morphogenesis protein
MNPNAQLRDAYTARQVDLTRYSNRAVRRMLRLIARIEADTMEKLNGLPEGSGRQAQLEAYLTELRALYARGYAQVSDATQDELRNLTQDELDFNTSAMERGAQAARINAAVQVPFFGQVYAAVESRPFQGKLLRDWLSELEEGAARRVRDAIRIGYVEGESVSAIKRRVRQIMPMSSRGAEAMVRTAINHTAQATRQQVFEANADIIAGEVWNAVLDARTTLVCQARDGTVYQLGKGPRPPAHINCRSYMSPVLRGIDPPARTDYGDWLRRQPVARQEEILGVAKARLFRDGKLPLDRFVDRAGNEYTLEQLRQRHPQAFEEAGL